VKLSLQQPRRPIGWHGWFVPGGSYLPRLSMTIGVLGVSVGSNVESIGVPESLTC
jgi:hypothetical protein